MCVESKSSPYTNDIAKSNSTPVINKTNPNIIYFPFNLKAHIQLCYNRLPHTQTRSCLLPPTRADPDLISYQLNNLNLR